MIAMTTNSSIKVKACREVHVCFLSCPIGNITIWQ